MAFNSAGTLKADILIVDDLPDNIRFLSNFLTEQGYNIRKAINGQMALKAIAALPPDLILLDINMPDMTGYEVCRHLKQSPDLAKIPVIFLSAGSETIDKVQAFQVGGVDYITKPFQLEEVLIRVQTQLTIRQLQRDLEQQNTQLKDALDNLKTAQASLVQKEKMSALKKVVAGVAHEINNPLSFIVGNLQPANDYIQQLITIIQLYQQEYPNIPASVEDMLQDIDLNFLLSDLTNLINSMRNGAHRIHSVVLALRIFTRLDESEIKAIDIHESIESCLTILQYRLAAKDEGIPIQVHKHYGDLPSITCYASQLNLAIFNLLNNAIDAIESRLAKSLDLSFNPQISIFTSLEADGTLLIRVKDNGIGVTKANETHLFEPFFTTKRAGDGVGLSLITSQRIIEELHCGQLAFHSENGETEFAVRLPLALAE